MPSRRRARREPVFTDGTVAPTRNIRVPWNLLLNLTVGFLAFKLFLLMRLGENTYYQKLSIADDGTFVGELGVRLMDIGPLTLRMRDHLVPIVEHIFIN